MRFPVLQFGTSRFLQAHADLFIHEAAAAGQDAGPVAIVASSGNAARRSRLAAFDAPEGYPVEIRGLEKGEPVSRDIRVTSVRRGLDAATDWPDLVQLGCEADFLISNVSDAGYAVPAGFTADLAEGAPAPASFPAKLLTLLASRHRAGRPGPVILPTELVRRNGDVLAGLVRDLAQRSGASADFLGWLDRDCVFVNSLVDRIVSSPLEPAGAVAEPYALWAIEDRPGLRLPCTHPAIVVTADLERFERLKLHILNLGHTVLADDWLEAGSPAGLTVKAALADPAVSDRLKRLYAEEVVPGFAARGLRDEAAAYVATTLDRFANPFLEHRIADIAAGHAEKLERRLADFLAWSGTDAPELKNLLHRARNRIIRSKGATVA